MKTYFSFCFVLVLSFCGFAQENNTVYEMVVYPGCENNNNTYSHSHQLKNTVLLNCFSKQINFAYNENLDVEKLEDYMITKGFSTIQGKLNFYINEKGEIDNIVALEGSNEFLSSVAIETFKKINSDLKKLNKKIVPAKMENGEPIKMKFTYPIGFYINYIIEK